MNKDTKFYDVIGNSVEIKQAKFVKFIHNLGIWRYYPDQKNFIFVTIQDSIVRELRIPEIKDMVFARLDSSLRKNKEQVIEKIHRMIPTLFSKPLLETLPVAQIKIVKDTCDLSFAFYKSRFFKVTADAIVPLNYTYLPGPIWISQILDRDISELPEFLVTKKSVFEMFCVLICGGNEEKLSSLRSIIGYLLHGYKDPANPKAVIFTENQSEDDSGIPNGGTGKGLIMSAIKSFKKTTKEDGKLFSTKSNFIFQQVDLDTQILLFDDVKPDFDFLKLFSVISEGVQVEKKYQDKFSIPYNESPKVVITSNYVLPGIGESYERRRIEFKLERYFNAKHRPIDEFGHLFFVDWDDVEWARFDHFMLSCIQHFLKNGIIEFSEPEILKDRLETITTPAFAEFCFQRLELNKEYDAKQLYLTYKDFAGNETAIIKQNMFSRFIEKFTEIEDLKCNTRMSNGKKFITLHKKVK